MIDNPRTVEEARRYRYGCWGGLPKGRAYREGDCAYEVFPNERGALHHQCERRNGYGLAGLYCKQHARWVPAANEVSRRAAGPTQANG